MDTQVQLKSGTISILVGPTPSRAELEFVREAYLPTTFRQVIVLSSKNLVQLCNFMRRCRAEKATHKYLVFLQFHPHRDTWRLLDVYKQLGLTVIIYGGPCVTFHVQEVHPYAQYILEWYKRRTYAKRPIIHVCKIQSQRVGVLRIFDSVFKTNVENPIQETCIEWLTDRVPLSGYVSGSSFSSLKNIPSGSFQANSYQQQHAQSTKRGPALASETMNVGKACSLLELAEADIRDENTIRKAYRKKAMQWHPDKHQGKSAEELKDIEQKFAAASDANEFLINLLQQN